MVHTEGGITLHDGSFIPGVIEDFDEEGNFLGYIENLGGPGTKMIRYGDNYPWSFTKAALFDASFVKLREISLGYSFPQNIANSIGVRNRSEEHTSELQSRGHLVCRLLL